MSTKIITVSGSTPSESTGADVNKGAPLNAAEFDQNLVNLRAGIDRRMLKDNDSATLAVGSVSAPSLAFTGDTDTGLYRIGANNIGVAASGAKVLDIGTSGLGITGALSVTNGITATAKTSAIALQMSGRASDNLSVISAMNNASSVNYGGIQFSSTDIRVQIGSGFTDRLTVSATGIAVTGAMVASTGFACNGKTAQTAYTVNAASTDLSTVVALCNQLRAALIANGICV